MQTRAPIVLIGGCGLSSAYWHDVEALLPSREVIGVDRPGLGGTRWPGHLSTLDEEVARLIHLLEPLASPAILVGHSMGAFHAEALVRTRPDLAAGLVLVDPSVEFLAGPPGTTSARWAGAVHRLSNNAPIGRVGGLVWRLGSWVQTHRQFGADRERGLPAVPLDADTLAAATAESLAYPRQAWHLVLLRRDHAWPGLPGAVLTAADGWGADRWITEQRRLADLLGLPQLVIDGSKHLMMYDRPDVVAAAITAI